MAELLSFRMGIAKKGVVEAVENSGEYGVGAAGIRRYEALLEGLLRGRAK